MVSSALSDGVAQEVLRCRDNRPVGSCCLPDRLLDLVDPVCPAKRYWYWIIWLEVVHLRFPSHSHPLLLQRGFDAESPVNLRAPCTVVPFAGEIPAEPVPFPSLGDNLLACDRHYGSKFDRGHCARTVALQIHCSAITREGVSVTVAPAIRIGRLESCDERTWLSK